MKNSELFKERYILPGIFAGAMLFSASCEKPASPPPDILLFIADDMTWRDCEPYGNPDVLTPNIAKLASEGMAFDNMYTSTAMCGPSRQSLYTGLYPVKNGSYPNHSKVYDSTISIVHHFRDLGYRVALIGKQHYAPEESFPFEYLGGRNSDDGIGQDINLEDAKAYINADKSKPYLLIVATNQPHGPWNRGDKSKYNPDSLSIAPYMVDTKLTREELVDYYAEISYADSLVGYCMDMVDGYGNSDNTLFMFTSEQGSSLPFGKWTCYNVGLKTAFIAKWPDKIEPGTRNNTLAQYIDVVPSIYEAAGGDPLQLRGNTSKTLLLDGKSFYSAFEKDSTEIRPYVYGVHTTRGVNNGSENYPVRSIQNKQYKLIWNLNYEFPFYCSGSKPGDKLYEGWLTATENDQEKHKHAVLYRDRPEYELYDIIKDPFELKNLLDTNTDYNQIKAELLMELDKWMEDQDDKGIATEWKALSRFKGDTLKWKAYGN
ncbi:MAG: sulfatase [Bacteroidales bacterium]|nr:sulfatase [Bacteroidales bacterium]